MVNGLITCFYVFIIILDNLPCIINLNMVNALVLFHYNIGVQSFEHGACVADNSFFFW